MTRRICLVRQSYFPSEAHVKKNVDALVDAGFEVDVVCLREPGAKRREEYRGGTVTRLPLTHKRASKLRYLFEYSAFFLMALMTLTVRSLRRRYDYDIIEVYNIPDLLVFAALPAKLLGSRVVFYMFELMPEQMADNYGLSERHPLSRMFRWAERRSVRSAHEIIAVSPYQRDVILERCSPRGEPAVVPNVPDDELFRPRPHANGIGKNGTYRLLTHGSILRRYGIQTLVRAVPHLRRLIPDIEVWVLGEGEYRAELEQLSDELGVQEHVWFLDWVAHEDVPRLIADADLGIVPTTSPWLLPNKLFEYVAMERPVVAAASPSLTGIFDDQSIAYYLPDSEVDLARRVLQLHADPARARSQAERAKIAFQRYRWDASKRTYVDVHERLLAGLGPRPITSGGPA